MALKRLWWGIGTLFLIVIAVFVAIRYTRSPTPMPNPGLPTAQLSLASSTLTVEIASTDAQRAQGLSDRTGLLPDHGMLFSFAMPGEYGFWMKDMRFPLDIIFIDATGKVVTVDGNLSPQTYPEVFYPQMPALWVLEVPAGYAQAHQVVAGSKMMLL